MSKRKLTLDSGAELFTRIAGYATIILGLIFLPVLLLTLYVSVLFGLILFPVLFVILYCAIGFLVCLELS